MMTRNIFENSNPNQKLNLPRALYYWKAYTFDKEAFEVDDVYGDRKLSK